MFDDLVDAFSDEDVLGANSYEQGEEVEPPFANLKSSRGLVMKFDLKGPEDAPKLLYIPGATDDLRKTLTNLHFEAFAKSFHTLTCDLRNQGQTSPFALDAYVPLETHVDDLLALADRVFPAKEAFHVVGWSFGCALALLMARLHPERVRSVALLAGGYWDQQKDHIGSLLPGREELFGKDWRWVNCLSSYAALSKEQRCEQLLIHADLRRSEVAFRGCMLPSFEWHLDNFVRSEDVTVMKSPRSAKELGDGVLMQLVSLWAEGTMHVEEISTPTIIVHGRHDGMHRVERAVALKSRMKSAMLVILEDEGHVLVAGAAHVASSFLHPQTNVHPFLSNPRALTYERANAAAEEISAAYCNKDFQQKIDAVFLMSEASDLEHNSECNKLCLDIQGLVFEKFGLLGGGSAGTDEQSKAVLDLLRRRLAALETMVVVDRRKSFQKKRADAARESRSELYLQQKSLSPHKVNSKLDTEDFLRRSVQMPVVQKTMLPASTSDGDNAHMDPEDYARRAVQMRDSLHARQDPEDYVRRAVQATSACAGYLGDIFSSGAESKVDPEDYIRRALQMRAQQKMNSSNT